MLKQLGAFCTGFKSTTEPGGTLNRTTESWGLWHYGWNTTKPWDTLEKTTEHGAIKGDTADHEGH